MANIKRKSITHDGYNDRVPAWRRIWLNVIAQAKNEAEGSGSNEYLWRIYKERVVSNKGKTYHYKPDLDRSVLAEFMSQRAIWWLTNEDSDFTEVCDLAGIDSTAARASFRKMYPAWESVRTKRIKQMGKRINCPWNTKYHCWENERVQSEKSRSREQVKLEKYLEMVKDIQSSGAPHHEAAEKYGIPEKEVVRIRSLAKKVLDNTTISS